MQLWKEKGKWISEHRWEGRSWVTCCQSEKHRTATEKEVQRQSYERRVVNPWPLWVSIQSPVVDQDLLLDSRTGPQKVLDKELSQWDTLKALSASHLSSDLTTATFREEGPVSHFFITHPVKVPDLVNITYE